MQMARGMGEIGKSRRIRAGNPALTAQILQNFKQGLPARRIKMRGHLIQEQYRHVARARGDTARLRHNKPDQKSLLLAGRTFRGGHVFGRMGHMQVSAVRAFQTAPGSGIARALGQKQRRGGRSRGCKRMRASDGVGAAGGGAHVGTGGGD